ncbi:Lrp/AsnC family transcriptional regulator [Billgrantia kenyensis]|uniref:Lrp/AsnC family transcriptional regulator n=1 Tax=Billgrantia kenyensis TaxID=321266 RepID=A0A7W0AFM2_9GAMM|nr:Lrp/AsnC family transcriptional regulator [Halomonas kenyensis]MBA2780835.1 Lrp/AsnC family transcriptional regulator [Halomonas kenyensis]MCG6661717.1 Lrp/AsnC family transcriptional regulator [Halomonas kenyensis]
MDKTDRRIVHELQLDGRLSNQDLAQRVNLSPSPCLRRVRRLEEAGVIRGYTALVDQKAYGYPLTVFTRISLARHDKETVTRFERRIREIDEILDCFVLTGQSDYQLRVVATSLEDYERFMRETLHTIPGIGSIDTSFAFGVVKQAPALPRK